jgi:hypothetical protein
MATTSVALSGAKNVASNIVDKMSTMLETILFLNAKAGLRPKRAGRGAQQAAGAAQIAGLRTGREAFK